MSKEDQTENQEAEEKMFDCPNCAKTFTRKDNLNGHIRDSHSDYIKLFKCPECTVRFKHKKNFKPHFKTHGKSEDETEAVYDQLQVIYSDNPGKLGVK